MVPKEGPARSEKSRSRGSEGYDPRAVRIYDCTSFLLALLDAAGAIFLDCGRGKHRVLSALLEFFWGV